MSDGDAGDASDAGEPVLRVEGVKTHYDSTGGFLDRLLGRSRRVRAVDGVDFELRAGETLGVVGESGCGKTTLGRSVLRLVEPTAGSVYHRGEDLTALSSAALRDRRKDLQYVFQDPLSSLDPRLTAGDVVGEPLDVHGLATGTERDARVRELLETVGLKPSHAARYPHEFSGGQRQRLGIARALAVDPEVIVCDEPVSALDASVQAQILNLLSDLQAEFGLAYVFIAHDLRVIEHVSDRVAVMYLGEFVERGPTEAVFEPPYHPYTEALLSAIPEPDPLWEGDGIRLEGTVPSPVDPPSGCRFHTRCPRLVPAAEYDLPGEVWRSLTDLKRRTREADGVASLTAVSPSGEAGGSPAGDDAVDPFDPTSPGDPTDSTSPADSTGPADPTEVPRETFDALVREEFGLPEPLPDADAEATVADAIGALHDHRIDEAAELLDAAFVSPCERHHPTEYQVGTDHGIACLRYDDGFDEETGTFADGAEPTGSEPTGSAE
ncbi:ABC transporter ATP-binding protein [Halorubrum aethiopicum]|uniref:ABC transporter ATP-binding protein n=1 Tax=Halorubrum aethiopicum TaxID=1758255 RepID=UPI000830D40B|nr:oligopeptide/dipeptide ABC transporter ATP-binding protein [Halorubrum aethiopicum]